VEINDAKIGGYWDANLDSTCPGRTNISRLVCDLGRAIDDLFDEETKRNTAEFRRKLVPGYEEHGEKLDEDLLNGMSL